MDWLDLLAVQGLSRVSSNTTARKHQFFSAQISLEKEKAPTPVLLPGKSHGWRSLLGYRPWGLEELDTIELLHFHFSLSCIGESNGNPRESQGRGSLVGCRLCGHTESDMTEVTCSSSSFLYSPTLTSIHDYWKNHSFD